MPAPYRGTRNPREEVTLEMISWLAVLMDFFANLFMAESQTWI